MDLTQTAYTLKTNYNVNVIDVKINSDLVHKYVTYYRMFYLLSEDNNNSNNNVVTND